MYSLLLQLAILCLLSCGSHSFQSLTNMTGKVSYSVNSPIDSSQWRISSINPTSRSVQIVFYSLNIQQAELRIYETQGNVLLYTCISCGTALPPPFFSKTGSITVNIAG